MLAPDLDWYRFSAPRQDRDWETADGIMFHLRRPVLRYQVLREDEIVFTTLWRRTAELAFKYYAGKG